MCEKLKIPNRKHKISVHFSGDPVEWETPIHLFDELNREFRFTLDPCCTHENAKCKIHLTKAENGLLKDWGKNNVFMNPPYGRQIIHWMHKAYESAKAGALMVCLVPARTDTVWWHDYAVKGEVLFIRGQLKFGGCKWNAPFPNAIVVFRAYLKSSI